MYTHYISKQTKSWTLYGSESRESRGHKKKKNQQPRNAQSDLQVVVAAGAAAAHCWEAEVYGACFKNG